MRATPSPMQGRARAGGFTALRLHSFTASRRGAGAAGRREAQSRTTGAGRARRRGTPMQSRTREGAGTARRRFLPAFEAHAGPTPCSTLTGRWGQGATGGVVHLRDAQARHPTGHAAYLSHVSQAARRPGGRRTATAAAGEAGGLKTHHETGGRQGWLHVRGGERREGTLDFTSRGSQWWAARAMRRRTLRAA